MKSDLERLTGSTSNMLLMLVVGMSACKILGVGLTGLTLNHGSLSLFPGTVVLLLFISACLRFWCRRLYIERKQDAIAMWKIDPHVALIMHNVGRFTPAERSAFAYLIMVPFQKSHMWNKEALDAYLHESSVPEEGERGILETRRTLEKMFLGKRPLLVSEGFSREAKSDEHSLGNFTLSEHFYNELWKGWEQAHRDRYCPAPSFN
jgi:hypothetical protein